MMARTYIVMLNEAGCWSCGSDTVIPAVRTPSYGKQAAAHRESFRWHQKHLKWLNFSIYRGAIIDIPDRFKQYYPIYDVNENT